MPTGANGLEEGGRLKRRFNPDSPIDEWGLTVEQQDARVEELRSILVARGVWKPSFDFHLLLRFLRAREYEVDKALSMFLDHIQWRQENRIDHILDEFDFHEREEFLSIYPQGYHKTDKKGHPVYIQHLGRVDMAKIRELTSEERMVKYHVQEYERCLNQIFPICSKLAGRQIDKSFAIMDVKGVGLYHLTKEVRQMLSQVTKIDQDNYPETLYHTCIINAPVAFRAIWAVVKPMLNARTQAKVEVCPKNYIPSLLNWIDIENIPEYLGGKSRGTLVDDLGPWKNPDLLRELSIEKSKRSLQVPKDSAFDKDLLACESAKEFLEPEGKDQDATTSYDSENTANKAKTQTKQMDGGVDIDGLLSSEYASSKASRTPLIVSTTVDQGYRIHQTNTSTSPSTASRNKALTERIRDLEIAMSHRSESLRQYMKPGVLPDFKRPPRESLLSRVEVLERGMEVLLEAQEMLWTARQREAERRSCCFM